MGIFRKTDVGNVPKTTFMISIINYFTLFILFSFHASGQIVLQKEEFVAGKYRLSLFNQKKYSIKDFEEKNTREYTETGAIREISEIPFNNLFVALPRYLTPDAKMVITKKRILDNILFNGRSNDVLPFTVKGYLWIGDSYCANIEVNPISLDRSTNQWIEIEEFYIDFSISRSGGGEQQSTKILNPVIMNPLYGSQWQGPNTVQQSHHSGSWIDYSSDYVKLGVNTDGIVRIRYNDLISYGVPAGSIDPKVLKVYSLGMEIPIYVFGENDNQFNADDYIEFIGRRNYGDVRYREAAPYGSSYYEYLNLYSDTTIYWLNWTGAQGKRIDTNAVPVTTAPDTVKYYDHLIHNERDVFWSFALEGGDLRNNYPEILENERWGEGQLSVGKLSVAFSVSNLFPNKPARAFVKLQAYASSITTNAHNLALSINNTAAKYDSGFINKYQNKTLQANFTSTSLINGNNTVDIHSFATASSINSVHRDWYELEYPRYLHTTTDSLSFAYNNLSVPLHAVVAVSGLSSNSITLYKFKLADSSVSKIANYVRSNDTLRFADTLRNGNYYFLLRESKAPAPIFFYKKQFVNLRNSSNKADYLAITHPLLMPTSINYAAFISTAYGVKTSAINVEDIYDEFNYGFFSPLPIREFLKSTHQYWQAPKPKYAVLIGKGTYDF